MATKKKGNKGRRPPSKPSSKSSKPQSKPQAKTSGAGTAPAQSPAKAQAKAPAAAAPKTDRSSGAKPKSGAATRAERIQAAQRARRRKALLIRVAVVGTVVVLVAVVAFVVVSNRNERSRAIQQLETGSCEYDEETDRDSGPGRNHVGGNLSYETNPPSGGDHNPQPTPAGQYTMEQLPADSNLVHSLEHGYVILWHKPDLPPEQVDQLKGLATKYEKDVLLVPRPNMDQPVAATAWHRRLLCGATEIGPLETFITDYRNKGPEQVPHE